MYSSRVAHVHGNALACSISSMVEGSPLHVAHVHGNALMCSIPSMVEGSPSPTAHMWLMCMVMSSRVAFPQWWRGAPHVWLMCMVMPSCVAGEPLTYSSHVAHVHGNALTCSISSMVEGSPSRHVAHVHGNALTCRDEPPKWNSSLLDIFTNCWHRPCVV